MNTRRSVSVRRWTEDDIDAIVECQRAAYGGFAEEDLCEARHYRMQLEAFPEGQYIAEEDGRVVGYATSLILELDDDSPWYSYAEITGVGTFSTHTPSGDTLYGADIAVRPDARGRDIAGRLYRKRKAIVERFNLRRMVAGGRIPGYARHAGRMTPEQYVEKVVAGELKDQALSAHLKAGYRVHSVHMDYLSDQASLNYATFLEYLNPRYRPEKRRIAASPVRRPVRKMRVCCAQYQMRRIETWEQFRQQVEFFVSAADEYHCHFLLFPELFTAQLFSVMPHHLDTRQAVQELATYYPRYLEMFTELASRHGLHIIGGSHPVQGATGIRNVAHLFTPTGGVYTQDKLHITPGERIHWGIEPGEGLRLFDTPLGRIAIQVCYDIEFPELTRLLTLAGAEVVFVPFSTDERKSYLRIRYSSHGCAVTNMVYVVIAGNVGTLPQVRSFLLNYGQAAVLTPSDAAFPSNATAAEAEPGTEAVVISDLDLSDLARQRELGSVRPLRDRRTDLYELVAHHPVELIRTS
ncbi:MAG: GNAT family N-acetyltransferase [Myxococcales bacterium]|nr:GNAT family N-acetyltransferase [Myxococcales bacterium]